MEFPIESIRERIRENLQRTKHGPAAFSQDGVRAQEKISVPSPPEREMSFASDRDLLNYLLSLKDKDSFLTESYKNILGRAPDGQGYGNFMNRLNAGVSRIIVLHRLIRSKEAKSRGAGIKLNPGFVIAYYAALLKWAIKNIPVISSLILWPYRLVMLPSRFHRLSEHFLNVADEGDKHGDRIEVLSAEGRALGDGLGQLASRLETETSGLSGKVEALSAEGRALRDGLGQLASRLETETGGLHGRVETLSAEAREVVRNVTSVTRKLDLLNYELKKSAGIDISHTLKEISHRDFSLDAHEYFAFENMFRGSRATIKERQSRYVGYLDNALNKSRGSYVLDVGCGRGEFVELMKDNNIPSKGVDSNEENINMCGELDLDVELADALQLMQSVTDGSLIGVTAFQVVEHLNGEYLIEFLRASFQKIKANGILILETVNPCSLFSLRNFFIDPTHKNPIPPDTLRFLVEASGFQGVEIQYSCPVPDEMKLKGDDENTQKLNELLFGYQDYAVIGWK